MKILLSLFLSGTLLMTIFSCSKESPTVRGSSAVNNNINPPPPPPPGPLDTLKGKEYIFNNLTWTLAGPGFVADEEVWLGIGRRPDLFGYSRPMEVSVMFDTTNYWTPIPKWDYPNVPINNGFLYGTVYGMDFYVESYPMKMTLVGRQASVRIKFL